MRVCLEHEAVELGQFMGVDVVASAISYPHLDFDEQGSPRITGTRYEVIHLAGEHYHYGWSAEEILRQHPDLRPEQVYSALTYFYDHYQPMVVKMDEASATVAQGAAQQPLSRAELLKRRSAPKP